MGEPPEIATDLASEVEPSHAPEGEDKSVDIHKPKAAHSLREFLIEIGTIVCGIVIALGLEQAVDAAHNYAEVQEAREALHEELKGNVATLVFGMEEDKCLVGQLDAYAAWAHGGAKPPAFRSLLSEYNSSNWDTIKTTAVMHMPLHERLEVADFYSQLINEQEVVDLQRSTSLVFMGSEELNTLTPTDASRILEAVAIERKISMFHVGNGQDLLASAEKLGVRPLELSPAARKRLSYLCGKTAS